MHDWSAYNIFVLVLAILPSFSTILALSVPPSSTTTRAVANTDAVMSSRRAWFQRMAFATMTITTAPTSAQAADCFQDCLSNCRLIAPKDPLYCQQNCREYCDQPDRTDGLSGSISASSGEVGILGGTFGQGTVVKGEDKPPSVNLPGLDFSSPAGRKLLGY